MRLFSATNYAKCGTPSLQVRAVAALFVGETAARLAERRIRLDISPGLVDHICAAGYDQVCSPRGLAPLH